MYNKQSKYGPLRRGDVGPDGRIFFCYYNKGKELWYDEDRFREKVKAVRDYDKKCKMAYEERSGKKNCKIGDYDPIRNLYFIGRSAAKERWVSEQEYRVYRERRKRIVKAHLERDKERSKSINTPDYKRGDTHPEDDTLRFVYSQRGRFIFKKAGKEFEMAVKRIAESEYASRTRIRIRRKNLLHKLKNKVKRGTEINGMYFWDYNSYAKEIWIDRDTYLARRQKELDRHKRYREKRRVNKLN